MKISIVLLACCMALLPSFAAQAEIYESTDAQGNPVFTDTPSEGAAKVDLPQENIADSVQTPSQSELVQAPEAVTTDTPSSASGNVTVIPNTRNEELERGVAADMPYEVGDIPSEEELKRRQEAMDGEYVDEDGNRVRFEHRGHADGGR